MLTMNPHTVVLRTARTAARMGIFCSALAAFGCERTNEADDAGLTRSVRVQDFAEGFVQVDSVRLSESDSAIIARPDYVARLGDHLVIADGSEGDIKTFTLEGSLIQKVGRKGKGPGEFIGPRSVAKSKADTLYVLDGNGVISVFDPARRFIRGIRTELSVVDDLHLLPDGHFLVSGRRVRNDSAVAFVVSQSGKALLPVLPVRATGRGAPGQNAFYLSFLRFYTAYHRDTLYAVSTLSDTLWIADLKSGEVTKSKMPVPGYSISELPKDASPMSGMAWIESFYTARNIFVNDSVIVVGYAKGRADQQDVVMMLLDRGRGWSAFRNAPFIIDVRGNLLTAAPELEAEHALIRHYTVR